MSQPTINNASVPAAVPGSNTYVHGVDVIGLVIELAARLSSENITNPAAAANRILGTQPITEERAPSPVPEATAIEEEDDDEFVPLSLGKRAAHPLAGVFGFRSHNPLAQCCPTNCDDDANPITPFEQSIMVLQQHGDRFAVVTYPDKLELWVCHMKTKVWCKSPAAIADFLTEACEYHYHLGKRAKGGSGRKVFPFQQQAEQDELLRCLKRFNHIPARAWAELVNKVPAGNYAVADGFWLVDSYDVSDYNASDFITSDCADETMLMPYEHGSIWEPEGSSPTLAWKYSQHQEEVMSEELLDFLHKTMPDVMLPASYSERESMPERYMRAIVLGMIGSALLGGAECGSKFLVLTGAGADGKSSLMELLGLLLPHMVSITSERATPLVTPQTRIVVFRFERSSSAAVDTSLIKQLLRAHILPIITMNTRTDEELVSFTDLDGMHDRMYAFRMPSHFVAEESPAVEATKKANLNHAANIPTPPRDAFDSTNTYLAVPGWWRQFNHPEGKMAVLNTLRQYVYDYENRGSHKHPSFYDITYKYAEVDAPDSGVFGPHGNTQLRDVYARAMELITEPADEVELPFLHIKWALEEAAVPIAVRGVSTKVMNERIKAYAGSEDELVIKGYNLKPKYRAMVNKRIEAEDARKRLDLNREAARLRKVAAKAEEEKLAAEKAAAEAAEAAPEAAPATPEPATPEPDAPESDASVKDKASAKKKRAPKEPTPPSPAA